LLLALAAGFLTAADAPKLPQADDPLQGTWYIVSVDRPGDKGAREIRNFKDDRFTLRFDHGAVTSTADGKILWQGRYQLEPAATPPALSITRSFGVFKQGIYEQFGDTLKLCLDYPANPRPTKFEPARESRAELMTFLRLKPKP
jgi:uncharacterized protein (TIGR03067 family)